MPAKKRRKSVPAPPPEDPTVAASDVVLDMESGPIHVDWPTTPGPRLSELQRQAMQWAHIVRNRRRWASTDSTMDEQAARARDFLTSTLGITADDRARLATSARVAVNVPFSNEETGWEVRVLPWEFLLTGGTRDIRRAPLTVVRRLLRRGGVPEMPTRRRVLYVESAPGRLGKEFDFSEERRLVEASTGAHEFLPLQTPTRARLEQHLKTFKPHIVHLAGCDNHQGLALLDGNRADEVVDGYLLAGAGSSFDPVPAAELAELFTRHPPALVVCNLWNSASRISALLVAAGAGASLGFQDRFEDALSELFVGTFYAALSADKSFDEAFNDGWAALRDQPKSLHGTGITLWHGGRARVTRRAKRAAARKAEARPEKVLATGSVRPENLHEVFSFTVEPLPEMNYALLHNGRDLFKHFTIRKLRPERIDGMAVRVELFVDGEPYPYRETFSLTRPALDLKPLVRLALTSGFHRRVDELMRTSVFVEVRWGEHVVLSRTYPTTLTPIDQWPDTDTDRLFLPSFVFPRDPAVHRILSAAQDYVTALRDDPAAGFDGYQCLGSEVEEPEADVDNQVQAIWYSILYKVPLTYINPPATYPPSSSWQRVRMPTEVVAQGRGTCIDLALLLASCLEAVEIYPVIFLLEDHAFPGYWRTDAARDDFRERITKLDENPRAPRARDASAARQGEPRWYFPKKYYAELRKEVESFNLIPLESVGLTDRSSFDTAMSDGTDRFNEERKFDSMIDITLARDENVTPLPVSERVRL
jgi:hypothetical protein